MENKRFHFKQFSVRHDRSGMKVGTDGVLLGAWADVTDTTHILDIGTGTGVIALMLAQRTSSSIRLDAVELDENASEDARENITTSPWANRVSLHSTAIQHFDSGVRYDLITSNPPYFQNSYKPPDQQREWARHTQQLTFQDLLEAATRLLSPSGRLNVILPYTEGLEFIGHASQRGLHCTRKWSFKARPEKPIERWLLEFSRIPEAQEQGEIILYKSGEEWTEGYKALTREFYLKL
jgi:tRNA1Val (adenine37-N6)-methyltransferase